jgi:hypothetical protein
MLGVSLAATGYRPIPVINACRGVAALVNLAPAAAALRRGAADLSRITLAADARPVFIVDADRFPDMRAAPGQFDNRSLLFPEDFPSATFLRDHGVTRVALVRHARPSGNADLDHVLRRWQEGGITLSWGHPEATHGEPLQVEKPRGFRSIFHRASTIARHALRRHTVGGFGAEVPIPSAGGSSYG